MNKKCNIKTKKVMKGISCFIVGLLLISSCNQLRVRTEEMLGEYNFVVGTQTIGAGSQYKFTEKPALIETEERIRAMGSNILKITLNPVAADTETPEKFRQASPLMLASQESSIKALLEMDFTYNLLWVTTPGVNWTDGMSEEELDMEYHSIRELTGILTRASVHLNKNTNFADDRRARTV